MHIVFVAADKNSLDSKINTNKRKVSHDYEIVTVSEPVEVAVIL